MQSFAEKIKSKWGFLTIMADGISEYTRKRIEHYKTVVRADLERIRPGLDKGTLEERLHELSGKALTDAGITREDASILRDYVIQLELDRIMQGYKGEASWEAAVPVISHIHYRPSNHLASVGHRLSQYCGETTVADTWTSPKGEEIESNEFNAISPMGIMCLRAEKVKVRFKGIKEDKDKFRETARLFLYGFICQDLTDGYEYSNTAYPLLSSQDLQSLLGGK